VNRLKRLLEALKRSPGTPEEVAAQQEAERLRDEMATIRVSQRSTTGENYQSGRGSRH
jgi:hypothetical protein